MLEFTFTSYDEHQGKVYAESRPDYHQSLYNAIIDYHTSTGGQLDSLIDLGCGPGQATRALAPQFKTVFGLDPSSSMIKTARSLGGESSTCLPIRYEISTAEDLGATLSPPIADESVDLITVATAAHWFDMDIFWLKASQVLKPGGSIALWVDGETRIHPSVPNAAAIQATFKRYRDEDLAEFLEEGNNLSQNSYANLPLPWTVARPVPAFDESSFFRREWNGNDEFFKACASFTLDRFEKILGTFSPITRWREANTGTVDGENDIVKKFRRDVERLQQEVGVEPGKEKIITSANGTLIIIKKKP